MSIIRFQAIVGSLKVGCFLDKEQLLISSRVQDLGRVTILWYFFRVFESLVEFRGIAPRSQQGAVYTKIGQIFFKILMAKKEA